MCYLILIKQIYIISLVAFGKVSLCLIFFCIVPTTLRITCHCYICRNVQVHVFHYFYKFSPPCSILQMDGQKYFPPTMERNRHIELFQHQKEKLLASVENESEGLLLLLLLFSVCVYVLDFTCISPHHSVWWGVGMTSFRGQ